MSPLGMGWYLNASRKPELVRAPAPWEIRTSGRSAAVLRNCLRPVSAMMLFHRILELLEDRGIFQRGHILGDLLALCDRAQQAAHDLA